MKNNFKKLFAVLLTVALVATMFVMPTQAKDVTVKELNETLITNGGFEVGVEGMTPYGWHMTSTASNLKLVAEANKPNEDWTADSNAFSLKTKNDNGNLVAEFAKTGTGYGAMTTLPIKVTAGATYRLSYKYKTTTLAIPNNDISRCYGIRPAIQQFNANGELLDSSGAVTSDVTTVWGIRGSQRIGRAVTDDYLTDTIEFTVANTAETIILYINIGGAYDIDYIVSFDDITLYKYNDYELVNGDFEGATEKLDAGRVTNNIDGPANWYMVSCEQSPTSGPNPSDWYTAYVPILQQDETGNRYMKVHGRYLNANGDYTTRGYNLIQSDFVSVIPGGTLNLSYKFKSDELRVTTHSAQAVLWYFDANKNYISGASYSYSMGTAAVLEWTDYKIPSRTIPTNAVYVKIGFYYGSTWNAVNGAFYFDDVELTMESAAARNNINLVTVYVNGYKRPENFTGNFSIMNGGDVNHPEYVRVGSKLSQTTNSREGSVGAITAYTDQFVNVTPGESVKIDFDYKIVGYDKAMERQKALAGTSSAIGEPPTIRVRFYDAEGNIFYYGPNGLVTSDTGGIFGASAVYRADCDWSHASGSFIVPEGAVKMEWGYYMNCGNAYGSAHVNHYYDNVVVKSASDSYWSSDEYFNRDVTDLLRYVLLAEGDANNDGVVDLYDLVRMNNKINDATVTVADGADMNKTGNINAEDIQLLKWKLMNLDSEEKINSGLITEDDILKGKRFLFCGDSITAATSANNGKSWAEKTADLAGGVVTNVAKGGSTFIDMTNASPARGRIVDQIRYNAGAYDYLIFNGGVNDTGRAALGTLSESYDIDDIDQSTIIGSMEAACYYAHTLYPNAKIGYIVTYRNNPGTSSLDATMGAAKQVCEKWNIPYIDLYDGTVIVDGEELSYSLDILKIATREYFALPDDPGDVHIAEIGYDVIMPYILDWMYTLTDNVSPIPAK